MSTTTFSSTSGGSGSNFGIDVVVSGVTGTVTQIEYECTFSAFDHSTVGCDVDSTSGTNETIFLSGDLSGTGSTTQSVIGSSIPSPVNATYTFNFSDTGFANPIVNSGDCKVIITTSSGTTYTATGEDIQAPSQAESPDVTVSGGTPQVPSGIYAWYNPSLVSGVDSFDDQSGNGRDLTVSGVFNVVSSSGSGGTHAFDCDDNGEATFDIGGHFGSGSDSLTGGFAISSWVKFDSSSDRLHAAGFRKQVNSSSTYNNLAVGVTKDSSGVDPVFRAVISTWDDDATPQNQFTQAGTLSEDTWHHVLITGSGSNVYLYVNGVYQGGETGLISVDVVQDDFIWVGCEGEGEADDIRYYSRELNSFEIEYLSRSRGYGASPISLTVDSSESSSEVDSPDVITGDMAVPHSIECVSRVFAQQVCVQQMVGLSTEEEVFWYYPEYNYPNGIDLSPNYSLKNHIGGAQGIISVAEMWGSSGSIESSDELWGNPYLSGGRRYVDLRRSYFDQLNGDFSVSYVFELPAFSSMLSGDEFWLFGCGTDLSSLPGGESGDGFKVWISDSVSRSVNVSITFKNSEFGLNGDPEYYKLEYDTGLSVSESASNHLVISLDAHSSIEVSLNGSTHSQSLLSTNAEDTAFKPHMPGDWHLGAVNEDLSKEDFYGRVVDFRGYEKVLASSEISELLSGGKGAQVACDAGNPNAPEVLYVDSVESASEAESPELRPFRIIAQDIESQSEADEFYVLPIGLGPVTGVESQSQVEQVSITGVANLQVDSADSATLVSKLFSIDASTTLQVDSADSTSEADYFSLPPVLKSIEVNSADARAEAEDPYVPANPNQKLVTARSIESVAECESPNVIETGASDAFLIYCPSRSYSYSGTEFVPDLSGNHSPTSSRNTDIVWTKVDDEWAIDMRQTSNNPSSLTNAVEINVDPSESINSLCSPDGSPDNPFSVSMHFMFDQWPDQSGDTTGYNTAMGLYNFVVASSYVQEEREYFEGVSAGVRLYVVRGYNETSYRILCQLLSPTAGYWILRYSDSLSLTDLAENQMHHVAVTYDGSGSSGLAIHLNGSDVTGATSGTISSPAYSINDTYSDFVFPDTLRRAFIGRTCGVYPYQTTQYSGTSSSREVRGEAVPFWDDFRYFESELSTQQISRLSTRGVDLPAMFTLSIPDVAAPSECESVFSPSKISLGLGSSESASEVSSPFTVGFRYEVVAEDVRSFTRVEEVDVSQNMGVSVDSSQSSTESESISIDFIKGILSGSSASPSEVSSVFATKNISLSVRSLESSSEVFQPSLSGDGEISVNSSEAQSQASEPDLTKNALVSPADVQSQAICGESSLDFTIGLNVGSCDSQAESDADIDVSAKTPIFVNSAESRSESGTFFFSTAGTVSVDSVSVPSECESFLTGMNVSLSDAGSSESTSEVEDFPLVGSTGLEIDSCDSISESEGVTLEHVVFISPDDVESSSVADSPLVVMSPLRINSVECTSEVKGFTLPDLSNIKKGPPRLFLESDLIIGDY